MEKSLEEIEKEIRERKQEIAIREKASEIDPDTKQLLDAKKKELLNSDEARNMGTLIASEDIKANFASEASKINQRNADTAEREFDTKTRQRRLDRLNKELDEQHKYNMAMIKQNGEHNKMLDQRKKLVEKYKYLYNCDEANCFKAFDGEGKEYFVPKDFSFSPTVNRFRQFGRNMSKLDKPLLQTIKWVLIGGAVVAGIFILKSLGIIG